MDMYTGLRASVVVKPEWRAAIGLLHETEADDRWRRVFDSFPAIPGLNKWVEVWRRDYIPFGDLAYMPEDFSEAEDRESYSTYEFASGKWTFCCSLKNYENEIKIFVENVLAHIVERVEYCESLYEDYPPGDWRKWTTRWLKEGNV
jgi:hypothetical protein